MARVVLTQPLPRVAALAARLSERGHEVLVLAFSRIVTVDQAAKAASEPGANCESAPESACASGTASVLAPASAPASAPPPAPGAAAATAMQRLAAGEYDWVVFVSPAAVGIAAPQLPNPWPQRTGVAVVGPASRQALDELDAVADARIIAPDGPRFDADALIELPELRAPVGLRVLVLRGASGNDAWIERLRQRGAVVEVCSLYRREPVEPPAQSRSQLAGWLAAAQAGQAAPFIVVTLIETVQRLEHCLAHEQALAQGRWAPVLTIHPRIAEALHAAGWRDVRLLAPGQQALAAALESA